MTRPDQTDQTGDFEPLPLADAAQRLGISPNALLQRRKRGTVRAVEVAPRRWLYYVPPVGAAWSQPHAPEPVATQRRDQTDRDALVALLAEIVRENATLHAANAMLSERLRVLQDGGVAVADGSPIALASGDHARRAQNAGDAPETAATMPDTTTAPGSRPGPSTRVRRAWLALRGRE